MAFHHAAAAFGQIGQDGAFDRAESSSDEVSSAQCKHCGEPCESDFVVSGEEVFCCEGCRLVYELLNEHDLCAYYDDGAQGVSLKGAFGEKRRARFDYLDNAAAREALLHFSSPTLAKITLRLPQIHCASCLWLLERFAALDSGVCSARVDFLRKEFHVGFDPRETTLRRIVETLTTLGYEPDLRLRDLRAARATTNNDDASRASTQFSSGAQSGGTESGAKNSLYLKIGIAGFAFGNTMIFSFPEYLSGGAEFDPRLRSFFGYLSILLALPVLLYSASDYFRSSWRALRQGRVNLDAPIALGVTALFARSVVEITTGVSSGYLDSFSGLVFLLLCGKIFQQKTFNAIAFDRDYASYFPIAVTALLPNDNDETRAETERAETTIPLSELRVGARIFLRSGELVPADSYLDSPSVGYIDYSFVSGESAPVELSQGDLVYAGGRVVGAALEMTTAREVSQSYLTSLWNNETFQKRKKTALETAADAFGAYFTAFVIALAATAFAFWSPDYGKAVNAATAVLVIACPCAMTLAAPFALGWALKIFGAAGFYLKNTSVVLELCRLRAIVFDKTGTLTGENERETSFAPRAGTSPLSPEEQAFVGEALRQSAHPLSRALSQTLLYNSALSSASKNNAAAGAERRAEYEEVPGKGVRYSRGKDSCAVGSAEFVGVETSEMKTSNAAKQNASIAHLRLNGEYRGYFTVRAAYRQGLAGLFERLRGRGLELRLLSGDNDGERERLRAFFPTDDDMDFFQTPFDKLAKVRSLQESGKVVAMIGDGLNDAGALKQSNVGIALTTHSGAFSPACDAVLSAEALDKLDDCIGFAAYTRRVIIAAFWISVAYNVVGLSAAVAGLISPLFSAILMPVSNITIIGFTTLASHAGARLFHLK